MPTFEALEILGPAWAICIIIALTHAPLGIEVLERGIIFIDLAIAQIAGLGVVLVTTLVDSASWWIVQAAALGCSLGAAFAFRWIEHKAPELQEAIIGSSFVVAASAALLVLSGRAHAGEDIEHLLSGQVLFVTWKDVALHAPIYLGILLLWFLSPTRARRGIGFYILFAIAITSSVQLVGVYVVFASLILPAIVARALHRAELTGWFVGIVSVTLGIWSSYLFDLPSGPVVVCAYAATALLCTLLGRPCRLQATASRSQQRPLS